jgi:hypothetical protein
MANGMKSMLAHQMSEDIRHFSNKLIEKKRKGGLQGNGSESGSINTSGSAALMINGGASGNLNLNPVSAGPLDTVPESPELKQSMQSQKFDENLSGDDLSSPNNPQRLESKRSHVTRDSHHLSDHDGENLQDWVKRKNDFFLPMKKKFGSVQDLDPKTLKIDIISSLPLDIKPFPSVAKDGLHTTEGKEQESWNPKLFTNTKRKWLTDFKEAF